MKEKQEVHDIQEYRNKFIKAIEFAENRTEYVRSIADSLFSLGLTMYSRTYSFGSVFYNSFASSYLDDNIALHPEQLKVLRLINEQGGLIFSAPTSFGKTFVVFEYIAKYLPNTVVLVVPTLALVDEYKQKIIKNYAAAFSDYKVYSYIDDSTEYDFQRKNIFILTHDKVVNEDTYSLFESIDFLVIDEVYKLQKDESNDRVLILNLAYYYLSKMSKKYVLLAPFISGIGDMEKLERRPFFYSTEYSPVVNEIIEYDILDDRDRFPTADNILKKIPLTENILIYFPRVTDINRFISDHHVDEDMSPVSMAVDKFIEWASSEIHEEWNVVKALKAGYLVHNGQLPLGVRMLQLDLFNDPSSGYNKLLCTSTLLEGVNTEAKHIIITKPARGGKDSIQPFEAFDFFNLVGRTGRLFKSYLGIAHYIKSPEDKRYIKADAVKEINFEIIEGSLDIDINCHNNFEDPAVKAMIQKLNITEEEFKANFSSKFRFKTLLDLYNNYTKNKSELISNINDYINDPTKGKLTTLRTLCSAMGFEKRNFKINTYIINRLTYKIPKKIRDIVNATKEQYPSYDINQIINTTIRLKNSYIEFEFYSKLIAIMSFMKYEMVNENFIDKLNKEFKEVIDFQYFTHSPSKKILKDMGIFDRDVDKIIRILGNTFTSVTELQVLIRERHQRITGISMISQYVIDSLLK